MALLGKNKAKKAGGTKNAEYGFRKVFLFLAFFAPLEMMFLIFARNIIYPFGDQSFLISDLYHQYMPFFQEFVRKIKMGENLAYSWNIGLGSNFHAIYGYYLASPLHWLMLLFPESLAMEFLSYLVVVKTGLAGLSSFVFFEAQKSGEDVPGSYAALLFSFFYAMNGFVAAYNFNIMWLDGIILAPVILLGLQRLARQGKMGLYVISLAVCILSNFYISIFICIFLVLYFAFLFFTEADKKRMLWQFAVGSLLAGGMAGVILIPEFFALWGADLGNESFPKVWKSYFSMLEVLARHCMGIKTAGEVGRWPNIYCGSAVFLLIPLYVMNQEIPLKKKVGMLAISLFFLFSFKTDGLDYLWHGMNFPHGFPARQSFLYILVILSMCHDSLVNIQKIPVKSVFKVYSGAFIALLVVERFLQNEDFHTWDWFMTLLFVTLYAVCLCFYLKNKEEKKEDEKKKDCLAILCYVFVIAECTINMSSNLVTSDRTEYVQHLDDYEVLYKNVRSESDGFGFQRFENNDRMIKNDSALIGFPSASIFSSVLNSGVKDFYHRMGMRWGKVYYDFEGKTPFSTALLNVGYLFTTSSGMEEELYELKEERNGIKLYRVRHALPFGYVAPVGFDMEKDGKNDGITVQNDLVNNLGIKGALFEEVTRIDERNEAIFSPKLEGMYYGLLLNSDVMEITMSSKSGNGKVFRHLKGNGILPLGSLKEGDEISLKAAGQDLGKALSVIIYSMNGDVLSQAIQQLGQNHLEQVKVEGTMVSGHLQLEGEGRLIVTVPYEKGWKILVNGEEVVPEKFGNAFTALDLEQGEYQFEMRYSVRGKTLGGFVSAISICLFVISGLFVNKRKLEKNAKVEEKCQSR